MNLINGAAAMFGELLTPMYAAARLVRHDETYDRGQLRREARGTDCRAQVDRATEKMMNAEGYTATDQGIYILSAGLEGGVESNAKLEILEGPYQGDVYRLALPIDRDPAGAYWLCRGVKEKQAPNG
jgi:hypothetical protein